MKIIILFALASVGVCRGPGSYNPPPPKKCSRCKPYVRTFDRCDVFVNKNANDDNCMRHVLESVPKMLEIGKKLICKGRQNKLDKSFVYFAGFQKELRDFMGCTGCFVGKTLGVKEMLGHLGAAVAGVVGFPVATIVETFYSTGIIYPALDLTCDMLTGDLTSECVKKLSNSDLKLKIGPLQNLACMAKKDPLDLLITVQNMEALGCIGKDVLGIKDALGNVVPYIHETLTFLLKSVVKTVLNIPVVTKLLRGHECAVPGLSGGKLKILGR
ncbi:uncharacterized protein LOC122943876 [Bufo gargarizans]|uniref:uncharacterized protein LOC122943876 n=1 Tax=Bufo gargarizans TaxID=30331 RepID=UPI001CF52D05|nr:uncharacterized protein LOC122943876 [Bufo gargarizans]